MLQVMFARRDGEKFKAQWIKLKGRCKIQAAECTLETAVGVNRERHERHENTGANRGWPMVNCVSRLMTISHSVRPAAFVPFVVHLLLPAEGKTMVKSDRASLVRPLSFRAPVNIASSIYNPPRGAHLGRCRRRN